MMKPPPVGVVVVVTLCTQESFFAWCSEAGDTDLVAPLLCHKPPSRRSHTLMGCHSLAAADSGGAHWLEQDRSHAPPARPWLGTDTELDVVLLVALERREDERHAMRRVQARAREMCALNVRRAGPMAAAEDAANVVRWGWWQ
jgi:hypothetical protein